MEDEILYHYTLLEAFRSIVKSKTIRATESKYLNDATEFSYGLDLVKKFSILEHIPNRVKDFFTGANPNSYQRTYIFSLSSKRDLLSQWRAYCPNGGVNIGFSRNVLELLSIQNNFELVQCIYNENEQKEALGKLIESEWDTEDSEGFYRALTKIVASFKHPSFEEESEYRIIGQSFVYGEEDRYDRDGELLEEC